jgi:hypothetical protein
LTITSSSGKRTLAGEELTRTVLVSIPLHEPPARVKTDPPDLAIEMRLEEVFSQFKLSGNYFRTTMNGGVLENADAALELGEEYFYVSQRAFPEPSPSALKIAGRKEHRGWWVYRVLLQDRPDTRDDDIADLRFYLGRSIVAPKPRVEIIWPPASRFDADGTAVFADTVKQLIARSDGGPPNVETGSGGEVAIGDFGDGCYQITLNTPEEEAIVWMSSGASRRLRFVAPSQAAPRGVTLTASNDRADLASTLAAEVARQSGAIEVLVPSERLWRNARLNGNRLSPLPDGQRLILEGPLQDLRFGAFGSVASAHQVRNNCADENPWYAKMERIVAATLGRAASERLKSVRSKHQAVRWAVENDAMRLLPLVLSALPSEVNRGVS